MAPTARRSARASIGYSTSDGLSGHAERLVSSAEAASTRHRLGNVSSRQQQAAWAAALSVYFVAVPRPGGGTFSANVVIEK